MQSQQSFVHSISENTKEISAEARILPRPETYPLPIFPICTPQLLNNAPVFSPLQLVLKQSQYKCLCSPCTLL